MWRVEGSDLQPLSTTKLSSETILEEWISRNPTILGEDLLIIGRQVQVEDVKDKLDLLAVDSNLNTVTIELKKEEAKRGVDIQSLKYASYISNWKFDQLKTVAEAYFKDKGIQTTFVNALEDFVEEADYDNMNSRQKIVIVGADFDPKILSVAKWLLKQGVEIKLVRVTAFTDGAGHFLRSETALGPEGPALRPLGGKEEPSLEDGREWHLRQRCNERTAEKLQELVDLLSSREGVTVSWNQEFYVALIVAQRNWMGINTYPNQLNIRARVERGAFKKDQVAKELYLDEDKVDIDERSTHDRVTIKTGVEFDFKSEPFSRLINQLHQSFLKTI
jgi:hypothetical protein